MEMKPLKNYQDSENQGKVAILEDKGEGVAQCGLHRCRHGNHRRNSDEERRGENSNMLTQLRRLATSLDFWTG